MLDIMLRTMRMWLLCFFLLVTCPALPNLNNGMISCSLGNNSIPNPDEVCTVTCNTGYHLMGSNTRTCQNDGSWNGDDALCISE